MTSVFKSMIMSVAAAALAHSAVSAASAASERHARGFDRQRVVNVDSQQYPRLARQVERALMQLMRQRYSQLQPIVIRLEPFALNPRLRVTHRQRLSEPLRARRQRNARCGPQTLTYDAVRGRIQAKYRLRYQASSPAFGHIRAKAKGKVRQPIQSIENAAIRSRCGRRAAHARHIRHLGHLDHSIKPAALIREALARDIARELLRDLRGRLQHHRYTALQGQTWQAQPQHWRQNQGFNYDQRRALRR